MPQFYIEKNENTNIFFKKRDCRDWDTNRGDVGLIKVKKKLTLKFILCDLKHFQTMFYFILFFHEGAGWLGLDP